MSRSDSPLPSPDNPVSSGIYRLARTHRAFAAALLRDLGLHPGQEIVLLELGAADRLSQSQLVRTLMLDHSTVAKSLRRLETAGLIARTPSAHDRRAVEVTLTDAGRALLADIRRSWSDLERITVEGLGDEEKTAAAELMLTMERNVRRELAARREL